MRVVCRNVQVERPSEGSRLNLDLNLPLPARKSEKNLSSERRSTVVGLDKDSFMTPRKADFKSQYFFLFDDFLLQVVKKSKVLAAFSFLAGAQP